MPPWFALVEWPRSDRSRGGSTTARNMEAERGEERNSTRPQPLLGATAIESTPRHQGARRAVGCRGSSRAPTTQSRRPLLQSKLRAQDLSTNTGISWLILTPSSHHACQQAMHVVNHPLPLRMNRSAHEHAGTTNIRRAHASASNGPDPTSIEISRRDIPASSKAATGTHDASMVCPGEVAAKRPLSRRLHHGQEYGGRAWRGASLHSPAATLGRHRNRIYTTTSRCPSRGGLQRKQPCAHKTGS